ncbi:MAG: hypothetical protein NWE89_03130 [Candidatus Bathyarchaeota archaeon]|nr:hypothetical protein [Candidatus Bathyarchaeota archaeon]
MTSKEPVLDLFTIIKEYSKDKLTPEAEEYLLSLTEKVLVGRLTPAKIKPHAMKLIEKMGFDILEG